MLGGVWSCFVDSSWIYLDWPGYALLCVAPNWPVGRNGIHQSRKQTLLFFSLIGDYCGSPDGDQDGVCAIGKGRCPGYLRPGDNQYRWWGPPRVIFWWLAWTGWQGWGIYHHIWNEWVIRISKMSGVSGTLSVFSSLSFYLSLYLCPLMTFE